MTNKDQCREAFEAWASSLLLPMGMPHPWLERNSSGEYVFGLVPAWWEAWQAARSAPAAPAKLPNPDAYLYVNGEHRGVSLAWRGDMDLAEGTERHNLYTVQQVREIIKGL